VDVISNFGIFLVVDLLLELECGGGGSILRGSIFSKLEKCVMNNDGCQCPAGGSTTKWPISLIRPMCIKIIAKMDFITDNSQYIIQHMRNVHHQKIIIKRARKRMPALTPQNTHTCDIYLYIWGYE
jgi:hypothetical protein